MNPLFIAISKLIIFAILGFIVFRQKKIQKYGYKPFLFFTVNILLPLYYIDKFAHGWDAARMAGLHWAFVFFMASALTLAVHFILSRILVPRLGVKDNDVKRDLVALITIHNAGYIPLPIIASLSPPPEILVYMFFFILAFQILFWSLAVPLLTGDASGGFRFSIKPPLAGLILGLILAATGISQKFPPIVNILPSFAGRVAMSAILVVLGGALAGIPSDRIRFHKEFGKTFLLRFLLYPFLVFLVVCFIPFSFAPAALVPYLKLIIILEAAVPPATNLIIAVRMWGSDHQVEYMGSAVLYFYLFSIVTLPLFIILCRI